MDEQSKQHLKKELYEQFARVGKALGSPRRLEILDLLAQAEHSVERLAEKTQMSIASVSQHLQALHRARLVAVRREGTYAYYSLVDERVLRAWNALSVLAQTSLLEVTALMQQQPQIDAISAEELLPLLAAHSVTVLDARPEDEYRAGHIPGALSLPVQTLEAHLEDLPKDADYIAYCRTSYCLLGDELALALRAKGYQVRVLACGMVDWRLAGLPVESNGRIPIS